MQPSICSYLQRILLQCNHSGNTWASDHLSTHLFCFLLLYVHLPHSSNFVLPRFFLILVASSLLLVFFVRNFTMKYKIKPYIYHLLTNLRPSSIRGIPFKCKHCLHSQRIDARILVWSLQCLHQCRLYWFAILVRDNLFFYSILESILSNCPLP